MGFGTARFVSFLVLQVFALGNRCREMKGLTQ